MIVLPFSHHMIGEHQSGESSELCVSLILLSVISRGRKQRLKSDSDLLEPPDHSRATGAEILYPSGALKKIMNVNPLIQW